MNMANSIAPTSIIGSDADLNTSAIMTNMIPIDAILTELKS